MANLSNKSIVVISCVLDMLNPSIRKYNRISTSHRITVTSLVRVEGRLTVVVRHGVFIRVGLWALVLVGRFGGVIGGCFVGGFMGCWRRMIHFRHIGLHNRFDMAIGRLRFMINWFWFMIDRSWLMVNRFWFMVDWGRFMVDRFGFMINWFWLMVDRGRFMINRFWLMIDWGRFMINLCGRMINWFWLMVDWSRFMVNRFWLMIDWGGFMINRFWLILWLMIDRCGCCMIHRHRILINRF